MSRAHEPLHVDREHVVPPEFIAVSYTRHVTQVGESGTLEGMDGAEVARRQPSAVELRLDVRGCPVFSEEDKARIIACRALRSDRRGVVRVVYGEAETRPKNLSGARRKMAELLHEALRTPVPQAEEPRAKRGRAGLIKPPSSR